MDTSNGGLRNINSYYWVSDYGYQWTSSSGSTTWYYPTVYYFSNNGSYSSNYGGTYGVRPVVVLKSGIGTNDSKDTDFLGQTCWALINWYSGYGGTSTAYTYGTGGGGRYGGDSYSGSSSSRRARYSGGGSGLCVYFFNCIKLSVRMLIK